MSRHLQPEEHDVNCKPRLSVDGPRFEKHFKHCNFKVNVVKVLKCPEKETLAFTGPRVVLRG